MYDIISYDVFSSLKSHDMFTFKFSRYFTHNIHAHSTNIDGYDAMENTLNVPFHMKAGSSKITKNSNF